MEKGLKELKKNLKRYKDGPTILILKEDPKKIFLEDPNTLEVTLENMTLSITASSDMMEIWIGLERILFDQIETPDFIIWGIKMPVPFGEKDELFTRWAVEKK